jgi:dipeptidyl aminopeptidase/acylaminoacyl peptidase
MTIGFKPLILAALAATAAVGAALPAAAELPTLIPRQVLVGNPSKANPRISPDGTRLSYIAPSKEGVLNVWVKTVGKDDDQMVTKDTHRGIRSDFWAEDGKHLLYIQDVGGDENWHVYSVDLAAQVTRDLTPFQGIRAEGIMMDKKFPNEILVGLNLRDRQVFDQYRVDLTTGAVVMDTENPGDVLGWLTDPDFQIRGAVASNPADASTILRVRDSKTAAWRDIATWPFGEEGGPIDFTADGKALLVQTTMGSDTSRLVKMDAATGKELETIAQNPKSDLGSVLIQPDRHVVQAVEFEYLKPEWTVLDPSIKADFDALAKVHPGVFYVNDRDRDDKHWIVLYSVEDGPAAYYLYNRDAKKTDFLFVTRPELEKYTLAKTEPVVIKSRDGMDLVSYLTLPVGLEPKNLPLVLNVHGGPWGRDSFGFNVENQWLANRGYAVLQVNFRASTGFGKKFLNAGNKEWGTGKMQDDLTDAVKWAVAKGYADPKRVAIYGGSYGGYATLAGLVFTPELYCCGVDIVGPSNIKTLMGSIPPYWAPMKKQMIMRIGDVETDEAFNKKISPLFHADKIRVPLIIAQGANDPRVNIREAAQMVEAMRANKIPVTYVVYTDEGHGFARPDNRLDFYGRVDEFLSKNLGGRSEPWTQIKGSTAEVR